MLPVLILPVAACLLLAGCTGAPVSIAANTYPNVPNGYAETINLFSAEPVAVWVHGRTELAIVTVGSLNCPPVPTAISVKDASTLAINYVRSANQPCSTDISPTTNEFELPKGFDPSGSINVDVHFAYDTPIDYTLSVHD